MNDLLLLLLCSACSLGLSGLVSCLETVAMLADELKVRTLLDRRSLSPFQIKMISAVCDRRDQHMAGAMILQVVISVVSNSTIGILAFRLFSGQAMAVYMAVSIYATIVLSRSLPKVLARHYFDPLLENLSWMMRGVYFLTYPVVLVTTIWIRLLGLDRKRSLRMSELKSLVAFYSEKGVIGSVEEHIVQNALMLQKALVKDIKPSRGMIAVDAVACLADLEPQIAGRHDTYFIVHGVDGVVGVLSARDAALGVLSDRGAIAGAVARAVVAVDEESTLIDALVSLREKKSSRLLVTRHGMPLGVISAKSIYKHIFQGSSPESEARLVPASA